MKNKSLSFKQKENGYELTNISNKQTLFLSNLFSLHLIKETKAYLIKESDLTIHQVKQKEDSCDIFYEPFKIGNQSLKISCHLMMEENQLKGQITFEKGYNQKDYTLDYLDFLPNDFLKEQIIFTKPLDIKIKQTGYSYLANDLLLGQPVYLKGFYFGSLFPANDNQGVISGGKVSLQLRYYSGKNLAELSENNFTSWTFVVGATRSTNYDGMKEEFLADIEKISVPTTLRLQYNSWYDSFLGVSEKRFLKLAKAMNQFVEENQLPQFDAYVLDDGWNNYNDPEFTGLHEKESGTTYNQSGFWEFNDKFPNEGTEINAYLKSIGSTFGLWFGPQGGYDFHTTFAEYLESKGTGHVNKQAAVGAAIDVNDEVYVNKVEEMMLDFQRRFELTYWKLDGFATCPCTNPHHGHVTGGKNNYYYTTQLWERWLHIFDCLREDNPTVFLNLTSYAPISPWFLQWVNTVWLQNSGDLQVAKEADGSLAQQIITGRDEIYQKKIFLEKAQFPLSRFYNHEIIYGHASNSEMTSEEFRSYVFTNVFRAPLLWDLHLSPDLLTKEQWKILKEALVFLKAHIETLKNSQMLNFKHGMYGYEAKGSQESFLFLRNSTKETREWKVTDLPEFWQKKWQEKNLTCLENKNKSLVLAPFEYKIFTI